MNDMTDIREQHETPAAPRTLRDLYNSPGLVLPPPPRYPALPTPRYEIGGLVVEMTDDAARRWNAGELIAEDRLRSIVFIPQPGGRAREISLNRALNPGSEPGVFGTIWGMDASPIV